MLLRVLPILAGALAALLLVPAVSATHAGGVDNSHPDTWLTNEFDIAIGADLTTFTLDASLGVHKIVRNGATLTDSDIRTGYGFAADKAAFLRPIQDGISGEINTTLASMFPGRTPTYLSIPLVGADLASLDAAADGPVLFTSTVQVTLLPAAEGLGSYDATKIDAAFKSGAAVVMTRTFSAEPGHDNTFTLSLPAVAQFVTPSDARATILPGGSARIRVDAADNTDAAGAVTAAGVTLRMRDPAQTAPTAEDILIRTNVLMQPFNPLVRGMPMRLEMTPEIGALSVATRLPKLTTPTAVTLPTHLSADAVRVLSQSGILNAQNVTSIEETVNAEAKESADDSLSTPGNPVDTTVVTLASLDLSGAASSPLDTTPRLTYTAGTPAAGAGSRIYYDIGTDSITADAGMRAGATVFFNITIREKAGLQQEFTFTLQPTIASLDAGPQAGCTGAAAGVVAGARTCTVPDDTRLRRIQFQVGDPTVPRFGRETIGIVTQIGFHDLATSDANGLPLEVQIRVDIGAVDTVEKFPGALPDNVRLAFITADGMRILRADGVIDDADLENGTASVLDEVRDSLVSSFGGNPTVTGRFRPFAAATAIDASPLTEPVVFDAYSNVTHAVGNNATTVDAAFRIGARVFTNFTFSAGAGRNMTYEVEAPGTVRFVQTAPALATLVEVLTNWDGVAELKRDVPAQLQDPTVVRPLRETISNTVAVDLPAMAGLTDPLLPIDLTISSAVDSIGILDRLPRALPSNVKLDFLTADGFRLLRERGVVDEDELAQTEKELLENMTRSLEDAFPGGVTVTGGFVDASLAAGAPDSWPLWYNATAVARHDLGDSPDRADAAFEAGAIATTTFTLTSQARQLTTYAIGLPGALVFFADGEAGGATKIVTVDARFSTTDVKTPTDVSMGKDMDRPTESLLTVSISVAIGRLADGGDGMPATVDVQAFLSVVDLAERFPDALPDNIDLQFLDAAGFRVLHARGVITDQDLENITANFTKDVRQGLVDAFGNGVNVTSEFDRASLAGTGPLRLTSTAAVLRDLGISDPKLKGKGGQIAEVILAGGAVVRQKLALTGMEDADVTYTITLPTSLAFGSVSGADSNTTSALTIRLDGRGASDKPTRDLSFALRDPTARTFSEQKADIAINLDLQLDLELIKAIQTKNADMVIELAAVVTLAVIEVPKDLGGSIPADVELTYIPVDVLRKLWQIGVLNESSMKTIEDEFLKQVSEGLKGVAGGPVVVTGGLAREQLDAAVASPLGDNPLKLTASATIRKSLAGGTGGALALATIPLNLPLSSFQDLPTKYVVVLPKGLSVASATTSDSANSDITTGTRDGRDYIEATVLHGKTVQASLQVAITPGLLVDKFLPWLILVGFIVVGIVALPVWGVVKLVKRVRRKGGGDSQ